LDDSLDFVKVNRSCLYNRFSFEATQHTSIIKREESKAQCFFDDPPPPPLQLFFQSVCLFFFPSFKTHLKQKTKTLYSISYAAAWNESSCHGKKMLFSLSITKKNRKFKKFRKKVKTEFVAVKMNRKRNLMKWEKKKNRTIPKLKIIRRFN